MSDDTTPRQPDTPPARDEKRYWLDEPRNVTTIVRLLVAVCVALVVADFFYHKHTHYGAEKLPGFFAFFGFVSAVFLVLTAKQLRRILMRDEDYYD